MASLFQRVGHLVAGDPTYVLTFYHYPFLMEMATNFDVIAPVHDEIGRGDFLALYFASGVFGSFASLAANVLRGRLATTSLGASSAITGCLGFWCTAHAE